MTFTRSFSAVLLLMLSFFFCGRAEARGKKRHRPAPAAVQVVPESEIINLPTKIVYVPPLPEQGPVGAACTDDDGCPGYYQRGKLVCVTVRPPTVQSGTRIEIPGLKACRPRFVGGEGSVCYEERECAPYNAAHQPLFCLADPAASLEGGSRAAASRTCRTALVTTTK
jgi:hypothetical protein